MYSLGVLTTIAVVALVLHIVLSSSFLTWGVAIAFLAVVCWTSKKG